MGLYSCELIYNPKLADYYLLFSFSSLKLFYEFLVFILYSIPEIKSAFGL